MCVRVRVCAGCGACAGANAHAITAVLPTLTCTSTTSTEGMGSAAATGSPHTITMVEQVQEVRRAVALYPTALLCNHSCVPVARLGCFEGRKLSLIGNQHTSGTCAVR